MRSISRPMALLVMAIFIVVLLPEPPLVLAQTIVLKTAFLDIKPRFIREPSGRWTGLCMDLMKLISGDTGIKFDHPDYFVPGERVTHNLEAGLTDVHFGLIRTPDREKKFIVGEPLYPVSARVIVRKDDPVSITRIEDILSLAGDKKVLAVFGMAMAQELKALNLEVDDGGKDFEANMQKIVSGRGRCFFYSSMSIRYEMKGSPLKDKVRVLDAAFLVKQEHVVFSRKVAPEIVRKINDSIKKLRTTEAWNEVLKKYLSVS